MSVDRWLELTGTRVASAKANERVPQAVTDFVERINTAACPALLTYLTCTYERQDAFSTGNFEFWSWERLLTDQSASDYGGDSDLVMIADWMLDSEFCSVQPDTGLMVFLGGTEPRSSELTLARFLRLVVDDPATPHGMM
jgi:hypothetical protein